MKTTSPLGKGGNTAGSGSKAPAHFHGVKGPETPVQANLAVSSQEVLRMAGLIGNTNEPVTDSPLATPQTQTATAISSAAKTVTALDVSLVDPSPFQPRKIFSEEGLMELALAISSNHGLNNPIIVRPFQSGRFELIAGERRLRAIRDLLGWPLIDAIVRDVSDNEAAILAAMDNNDAPLTDYENGLAYKRLLDEKRVEHQAALAKRVGVSPATISRCLAYLELPSSVLEILEEKPGLIGTTVVRDFVALHKEGHEALVIEAVKQIAAGELNQEAALRWAKTTASNGANNMSPPRSNKPEREPLVFGGKTFGHSLLKGKRMVMDFDDADEAAKIYKEFKAFLAERAGQS